MASTAYMPKHPANTLKNKAIMWWSLSICIMTAVVFHMAKSWETTREQAQLHSLLEAQSIELDRQLDNLTVLPKVLASDPRLIAALTQPSPNALREANTLLSSIKQQAEISNAYLMDDSGLTIAANNHDQADSFVGKNYSFRPYFQQAIGGKQSTQYAVGVTTGAPGYFVAHPVSHDGAILGVVVLKLSLSHLPDVWQQLAAGTLVLDQFGIVILATDSSMLYARTQPLTDELSLRLTKEHIYPNPPEQALSVDQNNQEAQYQNKHYIAASQLLNTEQWQLLMLSPKSTVSARAALYCAVALVALSLISLMIRSYRYQRLLASVEKRNARQLERQVRERTQELEIAQQALIVESNFALLGRMSGAINHEINQPLASLRFNLATLRQLIETPDTPAEQLHDTIVDCDRTTKRIARVVEALRSIARPGNSNFSAISAYQVIAEVVDTVKRERPTVSHCLQWDDNHLDTRVFGNAVLLQQALLNLLYNAFDAVLEKENPRVSISISIEAKHAEISVEDNGPGVDAVLEGKLFDPFIQSNNKSKGLGLGLALASQIADRHHGHLSYRTVDTGGSCFILSLPIAQRKPHA